MFTCIYICILFIYIYSCLCVQYTVHKTDLQLAFRRVVLLLGYDGAIKIEMFSHLAFEWSRNNYPYP